VQISLQEIMSTKDSPSTATAGPSKPSPTANVKPNRLPAPTLFVGPPSRNASQLSVSRLGADGGGGLKAREGLHRQKSALGRSAVMDSGAADGKDSALQALKKASEREADAKWREMQR
jgi:hypothetical protein